MASCYRQLENYYDSPCEIALTAFLHLAKAFPILWVMSEIIFEVQKDEIDVGYTASALGYCIHTDGKDLDELRRNVKEAVECFFDETMEAPGVIRHSFCS